MDTRGIHLLEIVGTEGLRAVLRDSLDRASLVSLANGCRLKFPGMRTQSVESRRLIDKLVKGFLEDPKVRAPIMKALGKANEPLARRFRSMTPTELALEVRGPAGPQAGRALFALAEDGREASRAEIRTLLQRLGAGRGTAPEAAPRVRAAGVRERRLGEEIAVLRRRLEKAEAARAALGERVRELERREAAAQQEVVAARKEAHHLRKELAQAESERTRLREENLLLAGRVQEREGSGSIADRVAEMSVRVNQLIRENKKIAHDLERLLEARPGAADASRPYLDALAISLDSLRRDVASLRSEHLEAVQKAFKSIQDLSSETRATRSLISQWKKAASEPAPRRKGEQERVGLFVDVQNMYYAARQLNARLDFGALMTAATRDRRLIRAIAYVVQNRDIDQSGFLAMLQQKSYEVRRKDLKVRHDGSSKGDWDMEMALDILRLADSLDVVVLVSGDGDFTSLVTQIKTLGPKVEVYSFPGSTAKELIEAADRHITIDEGFLIRMTPSA